MNLVIKGKESHMRKFGLILSLVVMVSVSVSAQETVETVQASVDWVSLVFGLAVAVVGAALSFFFGSKIWTQWKDGRYDKALKAVQAAVWEVHETYAREIKAGREDGKLTKEEREMARSKAIQRAIQIGKTKGVDVIIEIGEEVLPMLVSMISKHFKSKN